MGTHQDAPAKQPRYGPEDSLATPRFSGVRTFGRLPLVTELDDVDVAVIGAPFDTGGTYRVGARFGPEAIRSASVMLRPYHEQLAVAPFKWLSVADFGDLGVVPGYIEDSLQRIDEGLRAVLSRDVIPIVLGGDHSVALAELRALASRHGPVGMILLDSHSDTNRSYFGKTYTHGTPFWNALEEDLLDPERVIQLGMRGSIYDGAEYDAPRAHGLDLITAWEIRAAGFPWVIERVRSRARGPMYLSLDVDFLDPAFAPATGTPEIGGFTTWELQLFLRSLVGIDFVGFDVVEVIPQYDKGAITALAAANAVYEFLALLATRRREATSHNAT